MNLKRVHKASINRALTVFITLVAVVMASVVAGKYLPHANADTANVKVSNLTFTGKSDGQPLREDDRVKVSFDWAAVGEVKPGDSFSVEFPQTMPAVATNIKLVAEDGTIGGECEVTYKQVNCKLNENFAGKDNVKGKIEVDALVKQRESDEVTFNVLDGPKTGEVKLKVGPVGPKGAYPGVADFGKSGAPNVRYPRQIEWEVRIPYSAFKDKDEIVITDTIISDNLKHMETRPDGVQAQRARQISEDRENTYHTVQQPVKISEDGKTVTLTVAKKGAWKPDQGLVVQISTEYTGQGIPQEGEEFKNSAKVGDKSVTRTLVYKPSGSGSIEGTDRGTFQLTKKVEKAADSAELTKCPKLADVKYQVTVTIDVTQSVNPEFAFPETVKKKGVGVENGVITYTEELKGGQTVRGYDSLPKDTKVTFTEDKPIAEGVTFGNPKFEPSEVIIDSETTANKTVVLTNPAKCTPPAPSSQVTTSQTTSSKSTSSQPSSAKSTPSVSTASSTTEPSSSKTTSSASSTSSSVSTASSTTSATTEPTASSSTTTPLSSSVATTPPTPVVPPVTPTTSSTTTPSAPTPESKTGAFTVKKVVVDVDSDVAADLEFPVRAEITRPGKDLEVKEERISADKAWTVEGLEPGTKVKITEDTEKVPVPSGYRFAGAKIDNAEFVIPEGDTAQVAVTVTNTYEKTTTPAPTEPTQPTRPTVPTVPTVSTEPTQPGSTTTPTRPVVTTTPVRPTTPDVPPVVTTTTLTMPPVTVTTTPVVPPVTTEKTTTGTPVPPTTTPGKSTTTPGTPDDSSSKGWWWLLLIPIVPIVGWLISKIPGAPSPAPAPAPKPSEPAPGQPSEPAPGQPSKPGQSGPDGERKPIKSVPSGATVKSDKISDFIG